MNDVEMRRRKLLEHTRNQYREGKYNPAIHPRYKATYNQLYPDNDYIYQGTLGIRCILCIIAFVVYIIIGMNGELFPGMDHLQVQQRIMQNFDVKLY